MNIMKMGGNVQPNIDGFSGRRNRMNSSFANAMVCYPYFVNSMRFLMHSILHE